MHVLMKGTGALSAGRAVKRLKRLGGDGAIAMIGRFRGATSSVPLLEPHQLDGWLDTLDGVLLYVHDDVAVQATDVEALLAAFSLSGELTAPASGPAESPTDTPAAVGSPRQVAEFLAALDSPDSVAPSIVRVQEVRLDHDMSCLDALERPLLVASMIVRDESDQIEACLASLDGVVDRVEIVDTGSADNTVEIARSRGATVTEAEWQDDFGAARNLALDRCRDGRFVLHIDADERFWAEDVDGFRHALQSTSERAFRVPMRNVVDARTTSEFEAVRVFATDRTKWVGRVHEYPADAQGTPLPSGRLAGVRIDHLGYDPEIVAGKDKWDRNVELAEIAYLAEPSFKTRLDLARSLAWRCDDQRAFEMFREAASDLTGASQGAAAFVIAHVALSHQMEGDLVQAHELAQQALEHCSGEYVAHLARARAWRAEGNDEAIVAAHEVRSSSELTPPMFDTVATRLLTDNLTVGALARLGHHVDAIELAVDVLSADPARFDEWSSLATMPPALRETGLPMLASLDTTGSFAEALVGEVPMTELAYLVLAHANACEASADTIITGLMAAVLSGADRTAAALAEIGKGALDSEQRAATAERCRLRNATAVADILEALPV